MATTDAQVRDQALGACEFERTLSRRGGLIVIGFTHPSPDSPLVTGRAATEPRR